MDNSCFDPLVTVIATFYNLEQFAEDCVGSIALQRGFTNYEILLVDDGSTDSTLEKLVALSEEYPNCRVIGQDNSGVSAARNRGVHEARGKYVTFVDGDDVVSPMHLYSLVESLERSRADMAIAIPSNISEGATLESLAWDGVSENDCLCYSKDEALVALLYETITEAPWGKLANRGLYLNKPFPVGRQYEDVAIVKEHIDMCSSIVALTKPTYGYRMRKGSVVHPISASLSQAADFIWAIQMFLGDVELKNRRIAAGVLFRMTLEYLRLRTLLRACDDPLAARFERDVTVELERMVPVVLHDRNIRKKDRARLSAFQVSPDLYDKLLLMYDYWVKGV